VGDHNIQLIDRRASFLPVFRLTFLGGATGLRKDAGANCAPSAHSLSWVISTMHVVFGLSVQLASEVNALQ
jgi:hypothetical protein